MLEPLRSRRILVTRPGPAGTELAMMLSGLGAECQWIPAISSCSIEPPVGWEESLRDADALLLTSKRGLSELLQRRPETSRQLLAHCAGDGTAALAEEMGFQVGVVASEGGLQHLVAALKEELGQRRSKIFWPSSALSRSEALDELSSTKIELSRFDFYDTLPAKELQSAESVVDFDAFIFASPSAFKAWLAVVPLEEREELLQTRCAIAIGATTAQALALCGWSQIHVAARPSNEGLLACCLEFLS